MGNIYEEHLWIDYIQSKAYRSSLYIQKHTVLDLHNPASGNDFQNEY